MKNTLIASLVLLCCSELLLGQKQQEVSEECLSCLCRQSTMCDFHRQCYHGTCGMFAITRGYWVDAGSLTVSGRGSDLAYESCTTNYNCASRTIQNYMARYRTDCNRDGVVDCLDHAGIHRHGPFDCAASPSSAFVQGVGQCLNTTFDPKDSLVNEIDWRKGFR